MSKIDGSEFKLYYSTVAITDSSNSAIAGKSWTEVADVATVERGNERSENEFNARSGVIVTAGPQKVSLSITIAYDSEDAFYLACADAIAGNTEIALADVDGAIATGGVRGIAGNFKITSFPLSEPDAGPATIQVEARSSSYLNADYVAPT